MTSERFAQVRCTACRRVLTTVTAGWATPADLTTVHPYCRNQPDCKARTLALIRGESGPPTRQPPARPTDSTNPDHPRKP